MNVAINPTPGPNVLHVFAYRIARKIFLKQFCGEGHPVLSIEEDLIDMARSKFQEYMLIHYSRDELRAVQPDIEHQIRISAASRIMSFDEDMELKKKLVAELDSVDLSSLFPSVH